MAEFIVGVLLTAAAVVWVLYPVFRPDRMAAKGAAPSEEGLDFEDELSPQMVALQALREIEFDRATGKLSDSDYDALHRKYTAEALAAMRAREAGKPVPRPGAKPAVTGRPAPPAAAVCPTHGRRPEPDALFCSECGWRLGAAGTYCAHCGTSLEVDARYCHACGTRSAA